MQLEKIVLHQVIREDNQNPTLSLSSQLLEVNEVTTGFIQSLIKSYTSKNPTYGTFDTDVANNPFQMSVKNYFETGDFLDFSIKAMNTLKQKIDTPHAKGGYVVFAHYIEVDNFIVTVMLDNSDRFVVNDENLQIEKLLGLDIDKVARANRINWKRWQSNEESYLSFIKGTRGVSNYFAKDFIGCTDFKSAKLNAKNLIEAIDRYMNDNNFSDNEKRGARKEIKGYIDKQINKNKLIMLASVSAHINPDIPDKFLGYVHKNNLPVGNFSSTRKSDFKGFERKIISGRGYKLEFDRNSENIHVDKRQKTITIKNIPEVEFED